MAGQSCFERPEPQARFLAEIRIRFSIFPSNAKKDSPFVPFSRWLGKRFPPFRFNATDFCFTTGDFNFPLRPVTVLSTTAKLEKNISDRCSMTGICVKYNLL